VGRTDEIGYPELLQDAMRGVVRTVLARVAAHGLPGDHHFYLTFRTSAPGVELSERLRRQWPDEMTIVLQNQFSNLAVDERHFAVTLRFDGVPERLGVPFAALTGFADPSVELGLRFTGDAPAPEPAAPVAAAATPDAAAAAPRERDAEAPKVLDFRGPRKPRG
jgi:hypothetical protein